MKSDPVRVSAEMYDQAYFLEHMEGADEFLRSQGEVVTPRMAYALSLAEIVPGARTLDLGCGRGEMAWHCARRGAVAHGADYAAAALQIAAGLQARARGAGHRYQLEQASADQLPYAAGAFRVVFMLDIVEHLQPPELLATLREVHRVLEIGGRLIVHTMPNADYYRWGYPMYRLAMRALGRRLPRNPRARWYRGETHVNIQSPASLRGALRAAGFAAPRVWLTPVSAGPRARWVIGLPGLRRVLCNDILAVAVKA